MNNNLYQYDFANYMGKIEMKEFLDSLDSKEATKILAYMDKFVEFLNINQFPNEKLS